MPGVAVGGKPHLLRGVECHDDDDEEDGRMGMLRRCS